MDMLRCGTLCGYEMMYLAFTTSSQHVRQWHGPMRCSFHLLPSGPSSNWCAPKELSEPKFVLRLSDVYLQLSHTFGSIKDSLGQMWRKGTPTAAPYHWSLDALFLSSTHPSSHIGFSLDLFSEVSECVWREN
eukprot:1605257-Amphidinium_carterae.1